MGSVVRAVGILRREPCPAPHFHSPLTLRVEVRHLGIPPDNAAIPPAVSPVRQAASSSRGSGAQAAFFFLAPRRRTPPPFALRHPATLPAAAIYIPEPLKCWIVNI